MEVFALIAAQQSLNESAIRGFATADEMEQWYLNNSDSVWAGVSYYLSCAQKIERERRNAINEGRRE